MESWDLTTGPYESLYPYFYKIFVSLGHEVQVVDNKKNYLPMGGQTMWDYSTTLNYLRLPLWNNCIVNMKIRRAALQFQPDLILLLKCENVFSSTIKWLKQNTKAVIINWDHDNPFWYNNTSMHLLRSIPLYDAFGIWARHLFSALYSIGCQRVEYMPMFFNVERFKLETNISDEDKSQFGCDIAFVGNGSPERAEILRYLTDFDLAIWGEWSFLPIDDPLRACVRGRYLDGSSYAKALQCAKISINVMNMQCRMASNTRTFEVTGMGVLLITEYSDEQAHNLFIEDKEIVCFRSPEDLREKVRYYLAHDNEREYIARAGKSRALREHTLEHRLKRIIELAKEVHAQHPHP